MLFNKAKMKLISYKITNDKKIILIANSFLSPVSVVCVLLGTLVFKQFSDSLELET